MINLVIKFKVSNATELILIVTIHHNKTHISINLHHLCLFQVCEVYDAAEKTCVKANNRQCLLILQKLVCEWNDYSKSNNCTFNYF